MNATVWIKNLYKKIYRMLIVNLPEIVKTFLRFWAKTYLYKFLPNRYGYYRQLRQSIDPNYVHERDKHPVRDKHNKAQGWKPEKEGKFIFRDYSDYDEYVAHQKQKYDEILKLRGGFDAETIYEYRLRFYDRFKHLRKFVKYDASIVCLGARQGTEVEVLRDLGYYRAYGLDLNPGPNNPYVRVGDFMKMDEGASSVDLLYTNCIDHAFDLETLFAEHARVIKEDGYVLYDISVPTKTDGGQPIGGAFEAINWDSEEDLFVMMLRYFREIVHLENQKSWKWILLQGKRTAHSDMKTV